MMAIFNQITVLCEGKQDEVAVRAFFSNFVKYPPRNIRVEKAPAGKGSGEQFVREKFAPFVKAVRRQSNSELLVVVTDADTASYIEKRNQLNEQLKASGQATLSTSDNVLLLIPERNMETWLHCLLETEEFKALQHNPEKLKKHTFQKFTDNESCCNTQLSRCARDKNRTCPVGALPSLAQAWHDIQPLLSSKE